MLLHMQINYCRYGGEGSPGGHLECVSADRSVWEQFVFSEALFLSFLGVCMQGVECV